MGCDPSALFSLPTGLLVVTLDTNSGSLTTSNMTANYSSCNLGSITGVLLVFSLHCLSILLSQGFRLTWENQYVRVLTVVRIGEWDDSVVLQLSFDLVFGSSFEECKHGRPYWKTEMSSNTDPTESDES